MYGQFTGRGIPISREPTVRGGGGTGEQTQGGRNRNPSGRGGGAAGGGGGGGGTVLQSSLDLIWSYERSHGFFGSNLPSSPSFVARYHRPRRNDEESGSAAGSGSVSGISGDRLRSGEDDDRSTSRSVSEGVSDSEDEDDDDEEVLEDEDDDGSGDERRSLAPTIEDEGEVGVAGSGAGGGGANFDQLPRNAIPGYNRRGRRRRSSRREPEGAAGGRSRFSFGGSGSRGSSPLNEGQTRRDARNPNVVVEETSPLVLKAPRNPTSLPGVVQPQDYLSSGSLPSVHLPRRVPSMNMNMRKNSSDGYDGVTEEGAGGGGGAEGEVDVDLQEEYRGNSTFGQTLFNCVNVLIGIGLLAIPLAFAQAGWVVGTLLLLATGLVTNWTAKLLAAILRDDPTLVSYSDIFIKAFGRPAKVIVSLLFVLELTAVSIALIVLFGDAMSSLTGLSSTAFKLIAFAIILPTIFLPLRFLSIASLIGIISSFIVLLVVFVDGLGKEARPGSLRDPMETSVGPDWWRLPLSFGLLMSGWSGHAVIPSVARDMKEPRRFNTMINVAYVIAGVVYVLMGVFGYIMFGDTVSDEITKDIMRVTGYPPALNKIAVWMIAINPICKFAITTRPLNTTVEVLLGAEPEQPSYVTPPPAPTSSRTKLMRNGSSYGATHESDRSPLIPNVNGSDPLEFRHSSSFSRISILSNQPPIVKSSARLTIRFAMTALIVALAILIPQFELVMAFLGSFSAVVICVVGPVCAYLSIFRGKVTALERYGGYTLVVVGMIFAGIGTAWGFLPLERIEGSGWRQ